MMMMMMTSFFTGIKDLDYCNDDNPFQIGTLKVDAFLKKKNMNSITTDLHNYFIFIQKSLKRKTTLRCEAIFHLLKIKKFTKQHIIRIVYANKNNEIISTNALRLEFSSASHDRNDSERCELVYVYYDWTLPSHLVHRSSCILHKCNEMDEWILTDEIILSSIHIVHMDSIINLYHDFTKDMNEFNLTILRKIASKKSNIKTLDASLSLMSNTKNLDCSNFTENNYTKHTLEVQIYSKSVIISHKQTDITSNIIISLDYLAKNDILAYVDFLQLNQIIFAIEENKDIENNVTSLFHISLLKLSRLSDRLCEYENKNESISLQKRRKLSSGKSKELQETNISMITQNQCIDGINSEFAYPKSPTFSELTASLPMCEQF